MNADIKMILKEVCNRFEIAIEKLYSKLEIRYSDKVEIEILAKSSFMFIFYLSLLNFKNNNSIVQLLKKYSTLHLNNLNLEDIENISLNEFKDLIAVFQEFEDLNHNRDNLDSKRINGIINSEDNIRHFIRILNIDEIDFKQLKELVLYSFEEVKFKSDLLETLLIYGELYQNFLKKLIVKKSDSRHRKNLGIYYTPRNVVRYTITHSLDRYQANNKVNNFKDLLNLKILDPAAGTGNFILEIFDLLVKKARIFEPNIDIEKLRILILENCVYGVDIDPIAIKILKWCVFLYVNTLKDIFGIINSKFKQGNSLITLFSWKIFDINPNFKEIFFDRQDFLKKFMYLLINGCFEHNDRVKFKKLISKLKNINKDVKIKELFDLFGKQNLEIAELRNKYFLWEFEFPEIFNNSIVGNGKIDLGFDIVIGNPPHVENKKIDKKEKQFFRNGIGIYTLTSGLFDYTIPFIELSLNLLKNDGILGFITANKFLSVDYGYNLRKTLIEKTEILFLVDISNLNIFKGTSSYPIILIVRKASYNNKLSNYVNIALLKDGYGDITKIEDILEYYKIDQKFINTIPNKIIPLSSKIYKLKKIIEREDIEPISNFCKFSYRPLKFTDWWKLLDYVRNEDQIETNNSEKLKFIGCANIEPFGIIWHKEFKLKQKNLMKAYIFKPENKEIKNWEILKLPKIVIREVAKGLIAAFDEEGEFGNLTGVYNLYEFKISPYYLLAILNSKIMDEYYKILFGSVHMKGNYLNYHSSYLKILPIINISRKKGGKDYILKLKKYLKSKNIEINSTEAEHFGTLLQKIDQIQSYRELYDLIIDISRKLCDIIANKCNLLEGFYSTINKTYQIKIDKYSKRNSIYTFYLKKWIYFKAVLLKVYKEFKINKEKFYGKIKNIEKKFYEIMQEYNTLLNKYNFLKNLLDNIIEFMYMN